MLYFDRIETSEGTDANKRNASICNYWYFLDKGFNFRQYVCNDCHYVLMISINLNDVAVLNIKVLIITVLLIQLTKVKP